VKKKLKTDKSVLANKSHFHLNENVLNTNCNNVINSGGVSLVAKDVNSSCLNGVLNIEKGNFFSQSDVNFKLITEPVDLWRNLNGNNLLDLMYKDPKRYAFAFHSYVQ
jgi:hypothetical protein